MTEKQAPHYPKAPSLNFDVSQCFIDKAVPRDSGHCMIADALKAAYPWAQSVSVDLQSIRVSDPRRGLRYIFLTPHPQGQVLLDWDYGKKPVPFPVKLRGDTAMVVEMGRGHVKRATQANNKKRGRGDGTVALPKKTVLRRRKGTTPVPVGGKEPPRYTGIRTFGLRNFKYAAPD